MRRLLPLVLLVLVGLIVVISLALVRDAVRPVTRAPAIVVTEY